ncbi:unnamed protein product [Rotaria sp. Silwood2]|nr:unnamed protein product [Rotaria sp. Silwood2]
MQMDCEKTSKPNGNASKEHTITISKSGTVETRTSADNILMTADTSPSITITFYNLSKIINVPREKTDNTSKEKLVQRALLDRISGQIPAKQVVALMGPSGSGKTTLLNVLAGRTLSGVTGDVWMNNQRYEKSMKSKLAYVLQQDIFFEILTVKQQLTYTALLRLPNNLTRQDKLTQVNQVIEQLHLQSCADTTIMLISGGEKKRVNIATELLTNPSVIFLDEPTSGLDSTSAVVIINILQELASKGKTILTSIHQPSSQIFQSFDQLILLADGKTIFKGKPSNALAYFGTLDYFSPPQYNPADFIMDLANKSFEVREELKKAYIRNRLSINGNQTHDNFQKQQEYSNECQKYLIGEPSGKEEDLPQGNNTEIIGQREESKWAVGFFAQISVLFRRNWVLTSKAQFDVLNCTQGLCLSIMFGLFWLRLTYSEETLRDRASFIYFMLIFWPFELCFVSVLSFLVERPIIDKERASGSFRLSSYYLAKCLSETPLKLVLPIISFIIAYWMANMNRNFSIFLGIIVSLVMVVLVAESIGLFLSASLQDLRRAWVAVNIILLILLLAGGYYIENIPVWLKWTKWLSYFKYGYDACLQLQFTGEHLYKCDNGAYINVCRNNPNGTFTGDDALKYFKPDLSAGLNILVLIGMFITLRLLTYISLRFIKDRVGRT